MQNKQAERFDRLRELAEQFTSSHPDQGDDFQGYNIPELINELQIYQAELEIQNDELRAAQSELEHSRTRLSRLFHRAPVGYALLDAVGMIVDVNQTLCSLLQTEQNTLVGKPFSRQILAADQPIFLGRFKSFYKNPKNKVIEVRLNRQDERPFFARLEGRFHAFNGESDDDGQQQLLLMISDITEQKNAEEALRESEARFRSYVENANDIIYAIDFDGIFTYISPNWINFVGEPAEAAIGRSFEPYVHPDDVHLCREFLNRVLSTGEKQSSVEYRVKHQNGSWRWHYSTGAPLKDEHGQVTGYLGIGRDITERKQAEQALQENERYLRTILQTTVDGFWVIDTQGRVIEVNDAYCTMSGYTREEVIGLEVADLDAIETPEAAAKRMQRIKSNGSEIFETRHRRKDGSVFPLEVSVNWLETKGGQYVCFCRDLTERKQQEEALRASEARWQFALEGARDGVWDWNAETNDVFFSRRWIEMLGYEPREISSDLHEWERRVHPEDMPAVRRDLENHFQGKTAYYQNEHRMLCKDGSYKWVLDRGKVVEWTEDGRPRRVIGTHADITEQKQREAEREALIRELQEAMSEVKTLSGLLPICANCKKIRDDQGYWNQIETYIQQHSEAEFSHGICRECAEKLYPDLQLYDD